MDYFSVLSFFLSAAKLGDECLHDAVCLATDQNSECVQKVHIARCKCGEHYYEIFDKNTQSKRCVLGKYNHPCGTKVISLSFHTTTSLEGNRYLPTFLASQYIIIMNNNISTNLVYTSFTK